MSRPATKAQLEHRAEIHAQAIAKSQDDGVRDAFEAWFAGGGHRRRPDGCQVGPCGDQAMTKPNIGGKRPAQAIAKSRRRAFTAPPMDDRCSWDIMLRSDKSSAQCMRRKTIGGLCTQHAIIGMAELVAAASEFLYESGCGRYMTDTSGSERLRGALAPFKGP